MSGEHVSNHGNTQVEPWFLGFVFLSIFSVYLNNSSWITFCPPFPLSFPVPPASPGPTAAVVVALTVRAPQAPRRAAPGPTAAAVAPRRADPWPLGRRPWAPRPEEGHNSKGNSPKLYMNRSIEQQRFAFVKHICPVG